MKKNIEITYSFEAEAQILDRSSKVLKEYEAYYNEHILPGIREVERRKTESRKIAYQLKVSGAWAITDH